MPDLPSRLDYAARGRDYVLSRAKKIDPQQVDVEGSNINIHVGSSAVMTAHATRHLAYATARLFAANAEKEDLDRYAWDRYRMTRKGASPAVARVRVYRDVAGAQGSVPIGTNIEALTGEVYTTTSVAAFASSDVSSACDVRAAQAGKATQVGKNMLRRFQKPEQLFDKTLKVTNDVAAAGGEDAEEDEDFRNRIRLFWTTARRGTLPAIEFGALAVPGVTSARAIEVIAGNGYPGRLVNLYIADGSGVANATLAQLVRANLEDYRAGGVAVIIHESMPYLVGITLALSYRAGVDTVALQEAVRAAVVEFVNSLPVNGTLAVGDLYSVLRRYADDGVVIGQGTIVAPVGDLVPDVGQTLRTTPENVVVGAAA